MTRKEAKTRLQMLLTNRCSTCRYGDKKCTQDCEFEQAVNMAIEALSAEQKEEELAKDIARRMATIIENEQDMRVILKNASAEPTDLISRADALMEARPEYLNPSQQGNESYNQGWNDAINEYYTGVKSLPSADRPSGEWIMQNEE